MHTRWRWILFGTFLAAPLALACEMEFINLHYQDVVVLNGEILVNNSMGDDKTSGLRSFAVSPDGQRIALLNKAARRLRINDATGTGSLMAFEKRAPLFFAWSQDGARFALLERSVSGKARVTLAEVAKKTSRELQVPLEDVASDLAFAPDQKSVLVLTMDRVLLIGEKSSSVLLTRPRLQALTAGPQLVALADVNGLLTVDPADPASLKPLFTFPRPGPVTALAWSPDGKALFAAQDKLLFFVPLAGAARQLQGPSKVHTIARSPNGQFVAVASDLELDVFDGNGTLVFETSGASAIRWRRDSSALLLAWGDSIIELVPGFWNENEITRGVPFETKFETAGMALLEPDYLGERLVYSLFRTAGTTRQSE